MARRLGDTAQFLLRKAQGQLITQKGTKMLHAVNIGQSAKFNFLDTHFKSLLRLCSDIVHLSVSNLLIFKHFKVKSLLKISNIRYFYLVIVKVLAVECLFNFLKFKQKVIYILS